MPPSNDAETGNQVEIHSTESPCALVSSDGTMLECGSRFVIFVYKPRGVIITFWFISVHMSAKVTCLLLASRFCFKWIGIGHVESQQTFGTCHPCPDMVLTSLSWAVCSKLNSGSNLKDKWGQGNSFRSSGLWLEVMSERWREQGASSVQTDVRSFACRPGKRFMLQFPISVMLLP